MLSPFEFSYSLSHSTICMKVTRYFLERGSNPCSHWLPLEAMEEAAEAAKAAPTALTNEAVGFLSYAR